MTDTNPIEVKSSDPEPSAVPVGFRFAGVRCGIKQARDDLGVMLCDRPAAAAGCFTRNKAPAACVVRNASLVPSAKVHALVVNSGCANSMTGVEGVRANDAMASLLAELLGVPASGVLTASTGIIGVPLASDLVSEAVPALLESAGHDPMAFARAIVTTDTCTKVAHVQVVLPGSDTPVKILGVAKGSGMIHPNMATTFGFVCTDAIVPSTLLQRLLSEAVDETFNAITVDGDTSTNDMVLALAGGGSGVDVEADDKVGPFAAALRGVLLSLAKQVARDGEGATRLLEVEVTGAPTKAIARALARGVCRSNLVKCSAFAGQPEWGRVGMAVGHTAAEIGFDLDPSRITISALDMTLYDPDGPRLGVNTNKLRAGLRQTSVSWRVDLQQGDASASAYGCDMSYDYVRINADEAKQIEVSRAGGVSRNLTLAAYSPRLRHQLLCEGLAYVRRFTGLKILVYLQRQDGLSDPIASLARDLELCLDAGLKPLAILPDETAVQTIAEHMRHCGHFAAQVPPDAHTIANYLDRRHLCLMVEHAPAPDIVVDLALKLGIQKLIALGNDQGLRDAHGFVQRLSPDTFLAGMERGRFDASDADLLVLARHAANRGVPALHIIDARVPHAVVGELFTDEGIGTLITRQALA
jgi:glutamate N-acetyltransferase/amino-acid acetyltransferase